MSDTKSGGKNMKKRLMDELTDVFPILFTLNLNLENFEVKKLKSKRNEVYEVIINAIMENLPQTFIVKHFLGDTAEIEVKILRLLSSQGLLVPNIIKHENLYLLLEKKDGQNMCDFINFNLINVNRLSEVAPNIRNSLKNSVKGLATWFAELHRNNIFQSSNSDKIIVLNKGDVRLRDFIFDPATNQVYGVDFETSYKGDYLEDLSGLCCSLLDTNPGIFEIPEPQHKINLINIFLKTYYKLNKTFIHSFNFDKFYSLLLDELKLVKTRRNLGSVHLNGKRIINKIHDPTNF